MQVKVKFFTLFRLEYGLSEIDIKVNKDKISLKELLSLIDEKANKDISKKFFTDEKKIKSSAIILVNGKNIFHLNGLETTLKDGDVISLFPPGGGG